MQKETFVGIDISKKTLDLCVRFQDGSIRNTAIVNEVEAIRKFFSDLNLSTCVVAMENTGRYTWVLLEALSEMRHTVYVLCPIMLKKSTGLKRGKSDKIDAAFICSYISLHHNTGTLQPWTAKGKDLSTLKALLAQRSRRVKIIAMLKCGGDDYCELQGACCEQQIKDLDTEALTLLKSQIKQIEAQIEQLVDASVTLAPAFALMRSVPGAGKVLCWTLLAKTNGFTTITSPRKMACYAGVVPFEHRSGTSVRGRNKVSHYADKGLKKLLHLAAMSVIRTKGELGEYYLRKVAEGKSKMSVLNAIRNKIIHRIYATILNNSPYKPYNLLPMS